MRAAALIGYRDAVRALGGSPDAWMAEVGLAPDAETRPTDIVDAAAAARLLELSSARLACPDLGLRWAESLHPDYRNSGATMLAAFLVPNMQAFLDTAVRNQSQHTNLTTYSYAIGPDAHTQAGEVTGYVTLNPLAPPSRQFTEHKIASMVLTARRFIPDFALLRVRFTHAPLSPQERYRRLFQCDVLFEQPVNALTGPEWLIRLERNSRMDGMIRPVLDHYLRWRMRRVPKAQRSVAAEVASLAEGLIGIGEAGLPAVAELLELSPKKLQRALAAEGTNYSTLLEAVRRAQSHRLLKETRLPVATIANTLGYGSAPPYVKACRRWTGLTPGQYRKAARQG